AAKSGDQHTSITIGCEPLSSDDQMAAARVTAAFASAGQGLMFTSQRPCPDGLKAKTMPCTFGAAASLGAAISTAGSRSCPYPAGGSEPAGTSWATTGAALVTPSSAARQSRRIIVRLIMTF